MRIIEDRQEVTRDEYNNTLQKLEYSYQILLNEKDSILRSVNNTKKDLAEYNNMKVDIVQKYDMAFNRCEEKLKEIKREEGILAEKRMEQNQLTEIVTEFQERLNKRGESKLNTFNRMLEKEELKAAEKSLDEQNEKVSVQKQYLYQLKIEHDAYTSKKHMKLNNVRNVSDKILHAIESLNTLYKKLEELNKTSLVTNKEIMKQKLLLSEIEQELATTKVKIENEIKGDNIGTSTLKKIAALTKKIKSETRVGIAGLLGVTVFVPALILKDVTKTSLILHQPCIKVFPNVNYHKRTSLSKFWKFGASLFCFVSTIIGKNFHWFVEFF